MLVEAGTSEYSGKLDQSTDGAPVPVGPTGTSESGEVKYGSWYGSWKAMQVIGELLDVVAKVEKVETSRGGGTLVMICSKGYLSMVVGAEVGLLEVPSMEASIGAVDGRAGVAKLSRKACSSEVVDAMSSVLAEGTLLGDPC